jgi:hypothetical protein
MNEEPIGDFEIRIWNECREEQGQEWVFINWVLRNYPEVMHEFNDFDRMMSGD